MLEQNKATSKPASKNNLEERRILKTVMTSGGDKSDRA